MPSQALGGSGCRGEAGAASRAAAKWLKLFPQSRISVTCADIAIIDEAPAVEFDSELPEPPRRKRGLSEEERALWESVAKQVKPLRKRRALETVGRLGGSR